MILLHKFLWHSSKCRSHRWSNSDFFCRKNEWMAKYSPIQNLDVPYSICCVWPSLIVWARSEMSSSFIPIPLGVWKKQLLHRKSLLSTLNIVFQKKSLNFIGCVIKFSKKVIIEVSIICNSLRNFLATSYIRSIQWVYQPYVLYHILMLLKIVW